MEMMITIVIISILAAIALPSYQGYITRSRARTATADLMALATDLENTFQRTLSYPVLNTTTTATTAATTIGWSPAGGDFFTFSVVSSANAYTLTATGTGAMSGCNLSLTQANARTATASCGITSW